MTQENNEKYKGVKLNQPDFSVEIKYSDEAIENKLMRFTSKSGDQFVISAEQMMSMLVSQVNAQVLEAAFVETDRVNVVEVTRQIECVLNEDKKKGDHIRINYKHPLPVEFALIEEAYKIAKINQDVPVFTLTKDYIDEVRAKTTPEMKSFVRKFYEFFRNLKLLK